MLLKKANRFRESEAGCAPPWRSERGSRPTTPTTRPTGKAWPTPLPSRRARVAAAGPTLRGRGGLPRSVRKQEELVASSRDNPGYRRKRGRYLNNLGKLLASTGRLAEAEAKYREAAAVVEGLVTKGPPTPGDHWLLAQCHANLAMALRTGGRHDEAEAACRKARALVEKLQADFPDVPDYRHELAAILNNLGLLWTRKDPRRQTCSSGRRSNSRKCWPPSSPGPRYTSHAE